MTYQQPRIRSFEHDSFGGICVLVRRRASAAYRRGGGGGEECIFPRWAIPHLSSILDLSELSAFSSIIRNTLWSPFPFLSFSLPFIMSEIWGLIGGALGLIASFDRALSALPALSSAVHTLKNSAIDYIPESPLLRNIPTGLHSLSDKVNHHLQRIHNNFSLAVEDDPGPLKTHLPTLGTIGHILKTGLRISQQLLNGEMPSELTHLWGMLRFVLSRQAIYAAEHESEEMQDVLISLEMSK